MGRSRLHTSLDTWALGLLAAVSSPSCGGASEEAASRQGKSASTDDTDGPGSTGDDTSTPSDSGAHSAPNTTAEASHEPYRHPDGLIRCELPTPVPGLDGREGNLVECHNGMLHRVATDECPTTLPPRQPAMESDAGVEPSFSCSSDSECGESPLGYCNVENWALTGPRCAYGCVSDAECGDGRLCLCGDPVGRCVDANCTSNADCEAGALCAAWFMWDCNYVPRVQGFKCQVPNAECNGPGDCTQSDCIQSFGEAIATCQNPNFACGRPFVIEDHARLAEACDGAYGTTLAPALPRDSSVRAELAAYWTEVARMEHASVAAFARFSLQLLSLGAPAELIAVSTRAQAEELTHAQLAFALASAYADRPLRAGALSMGGALDDGTPARIFELVVLEGCFGETLAALEAEEACARTRDPVVRSVLARIARDEKRHAELAWRTLSWALSQRTLDDAALGAIEQAFATGFRDLAGCAAGASPAAAEHGLLASGTRAELRREAARLVIGPAYERVLGMRPRRAA